MNASNFPGLLKSRFRRLARALGLVLALAGTHAFGQATVTSLTDANHGKAGFVNGNTFNTAQFRFPAGIALDPSGTLMFVADATNNAIRMVNNLGNQSSSWTFTAFNAANGISHPIGIAVNSATNIFVLNFGNGKNGSLMVFNGYYYVNYGIKSVISTNATQLTNAAGISLDGFNNAYITVKGNTVIKVTPLGVSSIVGVVTNAKTSLRGLAYLVNGKLAIADSGNHGIWMMDPSNTNIFNNAVKFTGFHGAADTNGPAAFAAFNSPQTVIQAGNGVLVVADRLNQKVKTVDANGTVNRLYGVKQKYWGNVANLVTRGWNDGTVNPIETQDMVQSRLPYGLALAADGTLYDTETYYNLLRKITGTGLIAQPPPPPAPTILTIVTNLDQVTLAGSVTLTWTPIGGATNYYVKRSENSGGPYTTLAATAATSYTDTDVTPGKTYYYVVSAANAGGESPNSAEVSTTLPYAAVGAPQIGYVDDFGNFQNVPFDYGVANNDLRIVIKGVTGSTIYYTNITTDHATYTNINSGSVHGGYHEPMDYTPYLIDPQTAPYMTVKAHASIDTNYPDSHEVVATFQFRASDPQIIGTNYYSFSIKEITENAKLFYTLDGSDPRISGLPLSSIATYSASNHVWNVNPTVAIVSNTVFQVYAVRDNYQPSSVVSKQFLYASAVANSMGFGFASGPGSSQFIASPGQHFVVPVAVSLLPDAPPLYGLQFNLTVTNLGPEAIAPGDVDFQSLLGMPDPFDIGYFLPIPPFEFISTGQPVNDPDAFPYGGGWYQSATFNNTNNNNLLGVGWLEVLGRTNLYNTLSQNLLSFPIVDGTDSSNSPSQVVVGGYFIGIPTNATGGDVYQIQIGRPSATTFPRIGYGLPVFMNAPADTNLVGPGTFSALKNVTIGYKKYLVGDVYPANWYNAGDFGSSNLVNIDVIRVFDFSAYPIASPPPTSDLFDALDSCGNFGYDSGLGYYTNAVTYPQTIVLVGAVTNYTSTYSTNGSAIVANFPSAIDDYTNIAYIATYYVDVPYYITNINNADIAPPGQPTTNVTQTSYRVFIPPAATTLFNGNATNEINQIAFGDGVLDVCDVYVTFRRSLDSSLTWYERFWTNGQRVADTDVPNHAAHVAVKAATTPVTKASKVAAPPQVIFTAGSTNVAAGKVVKIPITATISGSFPIRLLMLNLSVVPLDNTPSLATPITFKQSATALGTPELTDSTANGNYSAVWLNDAKKGATGAGVTGTVIVGTLSVTIPATATSGSGYGIMFDHASASPNGLASFPIQTVAGTITVK